MRLAASVVILFLTSQTRAQKPSAHDAPNASDSGMIIIPESSITHPGDAGVQGHTNIQIFVPSADMPTQDGKAKNLSAESRTQGKG
jgi:hypothetical protein